MRVTMNSIYANILTNLGGLTKDMNRINMQISSGKLMSKISDNPVNLVNALGFRTTLSEIGQYQKNLKYGNTFITASENALVHIKDLTMRAKTLAIQQANAPMTPENRQNAAMEIKNLWEQAIILANSSVNGKYIFGGYRTVGYTQAEPAPFVQGARDGYFVNGGNPEPGGTNGPLTSGDILNTTDLAAGALAINGVDIGAVTLTTALTDGLNMGGAASLKSAINNVTDQTGVSASLTTLTAGVAATAEGGNGGEIMSQSINGTPFTVTVPDGSTAQEVAELTVAAINGISDLTGVSARLGNDANGGLENSVVLYNPRPGDETAIVVGPLDNDNANTGLTAGTYSLDDSTAGNTGQISLTGDRAFEITTSAEDDTILNLIGLGGGALGFADIPNDGVLRFGPAIWEGDLLLNGRAVTTAADEHSTIYADASAAAKAAAINNGNYGVKAEYTPASIQAASAVRGGDDFAERTINLNTVEVVEGATYTVNINGESFNYVAQADDTREDIATGLAAAINSSPDYIAENTDDNRIINITYGAGTKEISFFADDTVGKTEQAIISEPSRGRLDVGDLAINGIDILAEGIDEEDQTNVLVRAINAKTDETGVTASRDQHGKLILTAVDGRNIHVKTSARGERTTSLIGSTQPGTGLAAPGDQVYFGSVRLLSEQPFRLESARLVDDSTVPDTIYDIGFKALGLTGELDGKDDVREAEAPVIRIKTIHGDRDQVRYAGDRDNDISIKVGQQSTIEISKNGFDAVYDSGVFQILKELEHFLKGERITQATSAATAYDLYQTLDSGETGLALEDRIGTGTFKVTIANHDTSPPRMQTFTINVDPEHDTLDDIAQRLNGIPGLTANWSDTSANTDAPKKLLLAADPPGRFSFDLGEDTSGLLDAMGLKPDQVQASALQKSIADLETLMSELTNQISDFGARANRIEVQNNIYMNLTVATAENLSELEDTDLMKAIMEIKAKEVAYQAALNSAAKTMQLSLVNFL